MTEPRNDSSAANSDAQIKRAAEEAAPSAQVVRSDGDLLVYYPGFNLSKFVRFLALQPHVVSTGDDAQRSGESAAALVHRFEMESMALHKTQREWLVREIGAALAAQPPAAPCNAAGNRYASPEEAERAINGAYALADRLTGKPAAPVETEPKGYWICCRCDAPLSCAACGVEQPDDSAYYQALQQENERLKSLLPCSAGNAGARREALAKKLHDEALKGLAYFEQLTEPNKEIWYAKADAWIAADLKEKRAHNRKHPLPVTFEAGGGAGCGASVITPWAVDEPSAGNEDDKRIPLADHDAIGRAVLSQPWEVQKAIVTIAAHCTCIMDEEPSGKVADLAGCISHCCKELADALHATVMGDGPRAASDIVERLRVVHFFSDSVMAARMLGDELAIDIMRTERKEAVAEIERLRRVVSFKNRVDKVRGLTGDEPQAAPEWQPIATKPQWQKCEERGLYTDNGDGLFYFKATHWRPLTPSASDVSAPDQSRNG